VIAEIAGLLGIDVGPYSLRELLWAVDAKRQEEWGKLGVGVAWIVNSQPNFSSKRRKMIHPDQINPYAKRKRRRGVRMRGRIATAALDSCSVEAQKNGRQL